MWCILAGTCIEADDDVNTSQVVEDIGPVVKSTAISQMEAALEALSRDLTKLRTGRASTGLLLLLLQRLYFLLLSWWNFYDYT